MRLTNRLNLPASIVAAVSSDPYRGGGDISVTKLISPPYQRQLLRGVGTELVEDVSDRIWSLMGQIGHALVERMAIDPKTSVAEERLYMEVQLPTDRGGPVNLDASPAQMAVAKSDGPAVPVGKTTVSVSGQFDLIENGVLMDFKFTSTYSRDGKKEWEQQLNLLRLLCLLKYRETGDERYNIHSIQIVAIFRDWMRAKVGIGDYPESQVMVIPITVWSVEETERYMKERVALHFSSNPPVCTDEERWATDEVYALMKKGRKSAVKLYKNSEEAEKAAYFKGKDHTVIHRPRQYKRCESYCSVNGICPIWQKVVAATPF